MFVALYYCCVSAGRSSSFCSVSASTFPKVQVGNIRERRLKKKNPPSQVCFFSRLKPHSLSVVTKVILHSPGENWAVVTFKVNHAWNKACHFFARLVALKGLNLHITTLSVHYLTGWHSSWTNTETFCFFPQVRGRSLSNISRKKKENCVFFPSAAPSPKRLSPSRVRLRQFAFTTNHLVYMYASVCV